MFPRSLPIYRKSFGKAAQDLPKGGKKIGSKWIFKRTFMSFYSSNNLVQILLKRSDYYA